MDSQGISARHALTRVAAVEAQEATVRVEEPVRTRGEATEVEAEGPTVAGPTAEAREVGVGVAAAASSAVASVTSPAIAQEAADDLLFCL